MENRSKKDWVIYDAEEAAKTALVRIGDRFYRRFKEEKSLRGLTCGCFSTPKVAGWRGAREEFCIDDDNFVPARLEGTVDYFAPVKVCRIEVSCWKSLPPPKPISQLVEMDSIDRVNVKKFMVTIGQELGAKVEEVATNYKVVTYWLVFNPERFTIAS